MTPLIARVGLVGSDLFAGFGMALERSEHGLEGLPTAETSRPLVRRSQLDPVTRRSTASLAIAL
jgi:hypothetical protein